MFRKVHIKYIAFNNAIRDDALRAYIKCRNIETDENFTVIGFFVKKDGVWLKEENENCTLDGLLEILNNGSEIVVDTTPSKICESLKEGSFLV